MKTPIPHLAEAAVTSSRVALDRSAAAPLTAVEDSARFFEWFHTTPLEFLIGTGRARSVWTRVSR